MKRYIPVWLSVAVILSVFFTACTNNDQLKFDKERFSDEVNRFQNIVFAFNKDIYPDSMLGRWDSTEYVTFSPVAEGAFKWNSSSELVFSTSTGFLPETKYTATVTPAVTKYSKKKYALSDKSISFSTEALAVENINVSWTRGQNMSNVMVQLDVDFNYDVSVADAVKQIALSSEGKSIMTTSINTGNAKRVSVQFMPLNELDAVTPLDIKLSKGIVIAIGKVASSLDTGIKALIPSRFNLAMNNINSQHTGEQGIVSISTSQPIVEEGLKKNIKIEPAVPFEVETTESGITIISDKFEVTANYEVTISKKIDGVFGGKMKTDYSEQITFRELSPSVEFTSGDGMYLSTKGNRNIGLRIVNTDKIVVSIVKIYENNLTHFLRRGKSYDYDYYEDDYYDYYTYNTYNVGDEIFSKEYKTDELPRQNATRVLNLDFKDKIKSFKGTYIVKVQSAEHRWVQDSKVLNFSDVGLIVKQDKNDVYVFANSIRNATPLSGVKVSFISTNNQLLDEIITDNEGMAKLSDIENKHPGFHVGLVTATTGDEFSFISLERGGVETSRFNVGGRYPNAAGLNAMIYAERNLYRPGERIKISTIIRDEKWQVPGEMPVQLQLKMPNGKEMANNKKILNKEGSCETYFELPTSAITGTYTLNVLTGNDVFLNSYDISVEDFMPDRIKATMNLDKEEYKPGDSIKATLQVDNLFGTPASGRKYEAEMNMSKVDFEAKDFPEYDFHTNNEINYAYESREGRTNKDGSASFNFNLKKEFAGTGVVKGNVMATVFDETGRPIHRYGNFKVYTQPVFVGVKQGYYYVSTKTPNKLQLVAVDKNGAVKTGVKAHVTLVKIEWHSVIQKDGNRYRYVSQKQEKVIRESTITISGKNTGYTFTPEVSGRYEVRVSPEGSNSYVSKTIYAWGFYDTHYTSFEVNTEGNVTIKADKDKYNVGEDMKLLFTTPFEGRMLVTLERGDVIEHVFLNTENRSASYTVRASDIHVPNVYVSATLFRPMDNSQLPLTVAHGYKSVTVEDKATHIPVTVTAVEKSRSKTKQTIKIKTTPNAFVTVAAVDEGILQVKNYKTPDPYNYFYQKVALGVRSFDVYPYLMPEISTLLSSTGGDGAEAGAMRANPLFVNRVKNVSFWSGIKQADANGNLNYDIDIPQFSGDIRVMALAYKGKGFGSAEEHMKVADPVVISTALPRFFSPGDEAKVAVTVTNTTENKTSATVSIKTEGSLKVNGDDSRTVTIAANSEHRVLFDVGAADAIGKGNVTVLVNALKETFTNETEISIRPAAGLQKRYTAGQVKAGKEQKVEVEQNFIPTSARGKLVVSKSPLVEFTKDITDLVRYPYGCIEQTTSTAFPQLYYYDLVKSITETEDRDMNPGYNVREAILKIQSMQMYNGGMSYWQGGGYESWWGTVYSTHFLIEAKKAGYQVSANTIKKALGYMEQKLKNRTTEVMYYNLNESREIAAKEIPYSLFVLALGGNPQYSTMNYYKAHSDMLSIDGKYMLAAAYGLSGQKQKAMEVLPKEFAGEKSKQVFGGSFYSYIRDLAVSLYALQEINPEDPQVGTMARLLSESMRSTYYLNTQEKSFGILALGKIARRANSTNATAKVSVNGKSIGNTDGKDLSINLKSYIGQPLNMSVSGAGSYYYFAEVSGITADGSYKEEDSYLRVRRSFYTRDGKPITNNVFRQNDLVVVELTLQSQYETQVENVVVTDILPAGFEIENSRLYEMPDIKWAKDIDIPQHDDFRDDRVNMFATAKKKTQKFYYMVRVVTPGVYRMGPVQADAMYNGAFHSYHGAGTIKVEE
ncbi:MAG: alpha-2-macroglobulin family protein [Chitinophagales bacterium]|nr:alpha-2-macroglobulin family protein [Chitinophagaceae bacterium]MCB9064665.1 alpha-2-macroglobulin family protein [Chitinophagales bacterium]